MTKQYQHIKSFVLSKPQLWPNYLVFAGLCLKLFSPHVPIALAGQPSVADCGLSAVEAVQSPNLLVDFDVADECSFVLADNNFIQAPWSLGRFADKEISISSATAKATKTYTASKDAKRVVVTAYSSTPDQTDSTPFITAKGSYVYDGLVACNFLPFGTKVKFPEIYGDKIFTVEDRMASYNGHKMDIWMSSRELALQFGVKKLAMEVVK